MSKSDERKSRAQLIEELEELRRRLGSGAAPNPESLLTEAMIRRSHEGICACYNTPDYPFVAFTLWNDRMAEITGYTQDEINRLGWYQSLYLDPEDQARAIGRMAAMREGDDIVSEEWTVTRKDGERRVVSVSTMVLFTRGTETHVGAFIRDVTPEKRAEEALQYRLRFERLLTVISARFINVSADRLYDEMTQALEEIGEFAQVDRGYVLLFAEDYATFTVEAEWSRPGLARFAPLSRAIPTGNFEWWLNQKKRGETFAVARRDQVPESESEAKRIMELVGIKSVLSVPLISAGKLLGVLGLASASEKEWPQDHVSLVKMTAEIFGNAILRGRMEARLRESEEKHRLVFANANEGILVADSETLQFLYVNPSMCRMLGYAADELARLGVRDIHPAADLDRVLSDFQDLARGRKEIALDVPCRRKDGSVFLADIRTGLISLSGRPCVAGFFTDITERRKAEEERDRLAMVVRHSSELVSIAALDGRMIFLNEAGSAMLGVGPDEVARTNIMEVIPGHLTRVAREELLPALSAGGTWEGDLQYVNLKTGGLTDVHAMCFNLPGQRPGEPDLLANVSLDIAERKRADLALRESEEKYRTLFQSAPEGISIVDLDGTILDTNEFFGTPNEAVVGLNFLDLGMVHPDDREPLRRMFQDMLEGRYAGPFTMRLIVGDGQVRWLENHAALLQKDGEPYAIQVISRDVTDRKRLEEQLIHAQKMEAVGRLAGGVAHDFNNQLMVILNLSEFIRQTFNPDDPRAHQIELVIKAAEQSSSLTRQLLAFSRKQVIEPLVLDVNEVLGHLDKMLSRIIGEDVELRLMLNARPGLARMDPTQLEQVIVNLAVNARDAMPGGGKLTIETGDARVGPDYVRTHAGLAEGDYVLVAVSDSGHGIPAEVLPHVFEPFFTTKEPGRGTGLGLSTVYGIVKQAGGEVQVYSEVGRGTTFKAYLPSAGREARPRTETRTAAPPPLEGTETVMVVEDNDAVRETTVMILAEAGYKVIAAESGEAALRLFAADPDDIHLLVSDVVMTGISGRELASKLLSLQPDLKILYVSGYTDNVIAHHGVLEPGTHFLQKPFSGDALLAKVREILGPAE